jgi:hypothetical protein
MIAHFVAGILGRQSEAPEGYVGRHRAPRMRYAAAVRMAPAPAPTRLPELAPARRS